jgi:5-methylcytosine-specific restriction endonuclease McrA
LKLTATRCSRCGSHKPLLEFPPSKAWNKSQWCRACLREDKCGPPTPRSCDQCGDTLVVTARRAAEARVFCSRTCKSKHRNARIAEELVTSKPPRRCMECGEDIPARMRADARFCSASCNKRAHNGTRAARTRTGRDQSYVSRAYIIERDGGRCHLCGKRPRPGEIQLDHLIPVSEGGDHTPENLRVACAFCNRSKGARACNEQLLLVG